jgi:hypothetical protein
VGTGSEIDRLFDEAIRLEKRGAWERAISLYEQAAERWGDQPEAVYAKNSAARLREMQDNLQPPSAQVQKSPVCLAHRAWFHRGIGVSIGGALVLLGLDAVISGSFLTSFMVCPIWFLFSILKNAIQRPGWRLALVRIAVPAVTLGLVLANNAAQLRIAEANAPRIIAACEEFHAANGRFPKTLDELVPRYMPSVPRAKHCLALGEFVYWYSDGKPMLMWYAIPPFGRNIYFFENGRWRYID